MPKSQPDPVPAPPEPQPPLPGSGLPPVPDALHAPELTDPPPFPPVTGPPFASGAAPIRARKIVDGYDLTGQRLPDDVTSEEIAAALRAAGILPGEYNAPDWAATPTTKQPGAGVVPPEQFLLRRYEDGVVRAWRASEDEPPLSAEETEPAVAT